MTPPVSPPLNDASVLLDTDVFSGLFFGGEHAARLDAAVEGREMLLSAFSQAEVLAGAAMREWGPTRLQALDDLFARLVILDVTEDVVRQGTRTREAHRTPTPR